MSAYDPALAAAEAWALTPPWDRPGACTGEDDCGCVECAGEPWTREDQRLHESGL